MFILEETTIMNESSCSVCCDNEKKLDTTALKTICRQTRIDVLNMLAAAGSGHIGGCLSAIEIVVTLFFIKMRLMPHNVCWLKRDRFILSKGHAAPALYAVLAKRGCIKQDMLMSLRKCNSPLQGHPCARHLPAVEVSTGSLGQGLSVSNGIALGLRLNQSDCRVYCLLGDGEIQEGQVWEAAMAGSHYKLDNLCAILDYNKLQIDGIVDNVMTISPVAERWGAFGWHTISIDGHDMDAILNALNQAETVKGKPTLIIAHTIKGKGVSFYENKVEYHGVSPSKEELQLALKELQS